MVAALSGDRHGFGSPASTGDLLGALADCGFAVTADERGVLVDAAADDVRLTVLLVAYGWGTGGSLDSRTLVAPLS